MYVKDLEKLLFSPLSKRKVPHLNTIGVEALYCVHILGVHKYKGTKLDCQITKSYCEDNASHFLGCGSFVVSRYHNWVFF